MRDPLLQDSDPEARQILEKIIEEVNATKVVSTPSTPVKPKARAKAKSSADDGGDDEDRPKSSPVDSLKEKKITLRENVGTLRKLAKDLCEYTRGLRFMKAIYEEAKNVVEEGEKSREKKVRCAGCDKSVLRKEQAVLLCCGHTGCTSCLKHEASQQKCIVPECSVNVLVNSVVELSTIVTETKDRVSSRYGYKINQLVELIKKKIPKEDRILIFVQFDDLLQTIQQALLDNKIEPLVLTGTAKKRANVINAMQEKMKGNSGRVLLLKATDESASGANLTLCNHAIFIHPLLTDTKQQYVAFETQAIGRIRRYGQTKKVNIWRLLAEGTIDKQIYEERKYAWEDAMKQKTK